MSDYHTTLQLEKLEAAKAALSVIICLGVSLPVLLVFACLCLPLPGPYWALLCCILLGLSRLYWALLGITGHEFAH